MKKRVLSLILCALMLISSVPLSPLADIFTIEAFAGDITELRKVFTAVPDEDDWDLYIDTKLLESYYKQAKNIITWNAIRNYSQTEIDEVTEGLRSAIASLKFHTQSIGISSSSLSLEIGKTDTLKVTLNPENAGDVVTWSSSNTSVVSVEKKSDLEAEITVNRYSTSAVTITAISNGKKATCTVTTLNPLSAVKLSSGSIALYENQSEKLIATAVGVDSSATPTGTVKYTWSSNKPTIASVTDDGEVFGVAEGSATITVTATDSKGTSVKATCKVTVNETVHITALTPTSTLTDGTFNMVLGETATFRLGITPAGASFKTVKWTIEDSSIATLSDESVAGSTSSVKIKAVKEGKTKITYSATDGSGVAGTFTLAVTPLVQSVTLTPYTKVLTTTASGAFFNVNITPANAGNQVLSWSSSDDSICTVDKTGRLYPKKKGVCTITGTTTDGTNISASATVRVAATAESVVMDQDHAMISGGESVTLKATVTTTDGEKYNDVEWTSADTNIATVDQNGVVTAKYPGKVVIKATALDGTYQGATCIVTVIQGVTGVELPKSESVSVGDKITLTPTILPDYATNKEVKWSSSDESIATVNQSGVVTGKKIGTVTISCTTEDGGYKADCYVTVIISANSVILNKNTMTLQSGYNFQLKATVYPETATNKNIIWSSSDESVAKVNSNGFVSALAGGTAVITATTENGGYTAKCTFNVLQDPTGIELDYNVRNMYVGQVANISAYVLPETATSRDVLWSSSNSAVVTVDKSGMVTALKNGTAIITAKTKTGGYTATCAITVGDKINVTGLTLDSSNLQMFKGDVATILATIEPYNASEKTISWTSSNKNVATVNTSGVITAVGTGDTVITAVTKDGLFQRQCKVTVIQSVTGLSLAFDSLTLARGKSKTLKANIEPADATNKKIYWETSDESVVTVTSSGVLRAVGAGNAIILATTEDGSYSAYCNVTVYVAVTGVTLSANKVAIPKGEKRILTATISPADALNQEITWTSSDESIAKVDPVTGQVTGRAKGTAKITVTTTDGSFTDSCVVEVVQLATGVTLSFSSISLDVGKNKTIVATVNPTTASDRTVTWISSNEKVAKVTGDGTVKAISAGTATITATSADGAASATCKVTVKQPATKVTLSKTSLKVAVGASSTLKATLEPSNVTNKNVTWSTADKSIATVSSSGVVKGVKAGKVKITATSGDGKQTAVCTVTVYTPPTSVSLNKTSATLKVGTSTTLTPTVKPSTATYKTVKWTSSNYDVATVDENGKVTAKGVGYAEITATTTYGAKTAVCKINVVKAVTGVTLSKTSLRIEVGDKVTLKATVKPADATNKIVSWKSSSSSVASVSSSGVVTAKKLGKTTITVTTADGGYKKTCTVEVVKKVTGVALDRASATIYLGKTLTLKADVFPAGASNPAVSYSTSNKDIATVSSAGVVTPKAPGTVTITVKTADGSFTDSCTVTVKRAVTSVKLDKTKADLKSDTTLTLKATVSPSNATNKTVTWSTSNKKVATVSSKGVVTPVGKGTATITAKTENGLTAKCTVTVYQKVTGVSIAKTATVYAGEKLTLKASVVPADANNQSITWSTSNKAVATVDSKGVVTGVKAGTATITVKSAEGGFTAKCTVTVKQHVTSITLDKTALTLDRGTEAQLKATIKPTNATEKGYTFTSSNEKIATVSETGLIKAVACGKVTITVKSKENNKSAKCTVTVVEPVTDMQLSLGEITLYTGKSQEIKFTILPENATDKTVTFSSSDTKIAKVNKNGLVTAVAAGEALITVKSNGNPNIVKGCKIIVLQGTNEIKAEQSDYSVYENQSIKVNVTVLPETAQNKAVTFSSADEKIATVDAEGNVKGILQGETKIIVKSAQDPGVVLEIPVKVKRAVTGIAVDATEKTVFSGDSFTLKATLTPAEADDLSVTWSSSDESIAKVSAKGKVTTLTGGEVVITATSNDSGKTAQCKVTVRQSPESITLSADNKVVAINTSYKLIATVLPENTYNKEVTFTSSDETVATIDKEGNINALKVGESTIKATASDGKTVAECHIIVVVPVEKITLNNTNCTIAKGQSTTIKATVLPENATDKTITWTSSDKTIATVDKNGKVKTLKAGKVVIKASSSTEGVIAECIVNVKVDSTEITFTEAEAVVYLGEPKTLEVKVLPADNTNSALEWTSSDEKVATVKDGVVTAVSQGTVTITVKTADTGLTASCVVTVKKHTEGITLDTNKATVYVGKTLTLTATVTPEDATNKNVTWSTSDKTVATVKKGVVTALKSGTVTITAKTSEGGFKAECVIEVIQGIDKINIDKTELLLDMKESAEIKAEILPADAQEKDIIWTSSDEEIATVKDGIVTGMSKSGKAVIRVESAKDNTVYAECTVTVKEPVSSIELSKTEVELAKGKKVTLTAKVLPENANDKTVIWTSGDDKIATVKDGVITAVAAGTVEITVTSVAYGISAKCRVTVK